MTVPLTIDVVSDVICPWCFLGKRRLDKALAQLRAGTIEVRWRPFMLDPSIPPEGIDRKAYLTAKFGAERLATLHDPLQSAGNSEGVPFVFQAITRTPNTLDAHRVIRWAHHAGRQTEMAERLFMAYWNEGKDIGDRTVLTAEAGAVGFDPSQTATLLASAQDTDNVKSEIQHAYDIGVSGVPTFILAQRFAVSGAQPPDVLAGAIERAMENS